MVYTVEVDDRRQGWMTFVKTRNVSLAKNIADRVMRSNSVSVRVTNDLHDIIYILIYLAEWSDMAGGSPQKEISFSWQDEGF